MSNFSFLTVYGDDLAKSGAQAEECLYTNPSGCVTALRSLCEKLATLIVKERGLKVSCRNPNPNGPSLIENLIAIQNAGLATSVMDDLHAVRKAGNDGAHNRGTTVENAQGALKAAYRVAVWYAHDYKGSRKTIPQFVLPDSKTPSNQKTSTSTDSSERPFLDTPAKRAAAGVATALGIMWLWEVYKDPEHRWDFATLKVARIAITLLVLALLLLPLAILAHGMSIWSVYSYFVNSLSERLEWNRYLVQSLVLIVLMPFIYAVKMFLSPLNHRKQWQGSVLLIAMAVSYNMMFYYATKDVAFWFGNGHGVKYYARTDEGIALYDRPGYEPLTGQPLLPVTPEVARELRIQMGGSLTKLDPSAVDWFNPYTGKPSLWYYRFANGELAFFNRPGMDPQTGDPLLPVTKELYLSWRGAREVRVAGDRNHATPVEKSELQMAAFRRVLGTGIGAGAPGVLLLRQAGTDRGGIDALSRHLQGLNTSALGGEALEHQGYASRLYSGDASLVREAISVTHLRSLVVAEVIVRCEKRSAAIDPDLVSCDVTANAKKFDGNGNPAGSVLARGTGAGFNQADALEQAAQRASGDLVALARH